jgi:transcriptional regulator with XRE-family HTH domain
MSFVERFKDTFLLIGDVTAADIARRLGVTHATATNYLEGRVPNGEVLAKIANKTNVSLNWLLTGEGKAYPDESLDVGLPLTSEARRVVRQMAASQDHSFAEQVALLVQQALELQGFVKDSGVRTLPLIEMSLTKDEQEIFDRTRTRVDGVIREELIKQRTQKKQPR